MKYSLSSPLSLDECVQRLQAANRRNAPRFPNDFSKPLFGQVDWSGFSLRLAYGRKNPFAHYFQGSFRPAPSGTVLEGEFKILTLPKIIIAIWAGFILIITCMSILSAVLILGGIFAVYGEILISALETEFIPMVFTGIAVLLCLPFIMLFITITIPGFLFIIRRNDPTNLLNLLKNLLDAEIHSLP